MVIIWLGLNGCSYVIVVVEISIFLLGLVFFGI